MVISCESYCCWCFSGIAGSLKKLLVDEDLTVRQKATECLFVIAGQLWISAVKGSQNLGSNLQPFSDEHVS